MGRICAYLAGHSRQGLVFHAAAVSRAGRGIMLAGPTGAGKSTLTAYLLDGGYGCLSDELVFIRQGVLEFEALSRPTSLKVVCRRLSGADAGLQLMQCAVNARNLADHGLAEIGRLARAVSAYRLTYGELSQAAAALEVI